MSFLKQVNIIFLCWIIATFAMGGSLFFSEVMQYPPCVLCWYQRIAMYPLVLLFLVGFVKEPLATLMFTWPIASIGWLISLYHNLIQWGVISESLAPCYEGVSCGTVYLNWLGFITIPLLSLMAFSCILVLLFLLWRKQP